MGFVSGHRVRVGVGISLGMDTVSLRRVVVLQRLWLGMGAGLDVRRLWLGFCRRRLPGEHQRWAARVSSHPCAGGTAWSEAPHHSGAAGGQYRTQVRSRNAAFGAESE